MGWLQVPKAPGPVVGHYAGREGENGGSRDEPEVQPHGPAWQLVTILAEDPWRAPLSSIGRRRSSICSDLALKIRVPTGPSLGNQGYFTNMYECGISCTVPHPSSMGKLNKLGFLVALVALRRSEKVPN